jgi:ornithine carbamoyltransferase
MDVAIGAPASHWPDPGVLEDAKRIAAARGGTVQVTDRADEALAGAVAVASDTWVSMGQETEAATREAPFLPYRVTEESMALASPRAVFLHCLPAYRGKEVAAEVIDGPQSRVWDEAENRLHVQKALLTWLLENR